MAAVKRSLDLDSLLEDELAKLCRREKCEVCVVPLGGIEMMNKHYGGKIHSKKVERWKETWKNQKKLKMENLPYGEYKDDAPSEIKETVNHSHENGNGANVVKADQIIEKQENEAVPDLSTMPLDPRLIDSMDPSTMKKMLSKSSSRWDNPVENVNNEDTSDVPDDPDDTSIPIDSSKLLSKCFNPMTSVGYCQYCNKLLSSSQQASKHFSSAKHAGKVLTYQELLLSEAAILAGTAVAAPPPHRGHYCELCESDCSGQVQLDQHLRGERHRTNVRKMERELVGDPELDKDINPYNLPEVWLRERKHCNLCDVPIFSIRIAKIHFNSRHHRQAAGLNLAKPSREAEFVSSGENHCDVCDFNTETALDMKVHMAGIRHIENERTKAAVESNGGEWKVCTPSPPDPPKNSVQNPPQGMPMMGWGGGWGWGAAPVMPFHSMLPPQPLMSQQVYPPMMGGYPPENEGDAKSQAQLHHIAMEEASIQTFSCKLCNVSFCSGQDLAQHEAGPSHLRNMGLKSERDRLRLAGHDLPDSDHEEVAEEEEDFLPEPLPENPSPMKTKSNPFHCPFCDVWVPTITLLRFYHSAKEEHQENVSRVNTSAEEDHRCSTCQISASSVDQLWEACLTKQKLNIYGAHRQYSCEICDVHLSEQEWLDNHKMGEKHRWIADRVEKLLPVQFVQQEMLVVQKSEYNPFTCMYNYFPEFQCVVCKVGFTPIDKYKKHLGSLFHLRKCAGEDVHWVEGGGHQF